MTFAGGVAVPSGTVSVSAGWRARPSGLQSFARATVQFRGERGELADEPRRRSGAADLTAMERGGNLVVANDCRANVVASRRSSKFGEGEG